MPKKFKILAIAGGSIIGILILLFAGLGFYLSSNSAHYKNYLAGMVEENTGYKLNLEGDLSISVFPWIGVETGAVSIENNDEFKQYGPNLLKASALGVQLKLIPLLSGRIEVGDVSAKDLELLLVKAEDGKASWEMSLKDNTGMEAVDSEAQPVENIEKSQVSKDVQEFSIGSISLDNAQVVFKDLQAQKEYRLMDTKLETSNIGIGENTDIDLKTNVMSTEPVFEGQLVLKSVFNFKDIKHLNVDSLELKLVSEKGLLGQSEVNINGKFNLDGSIVDIAEFHLDGLGSQIKLSGKGDIDKLAFNGDLTVNSNPKQVLMVLGQDFTLSDPTLLEKFELSAKLSSNEVNKTKVEGMQAKLDNTSITGNFTISFHDNLSIAGSMHVDNVALDGYLPEAGRQEVNSAHGGQGSAGQGGSANTNGQAYEKPGLGLNINLGIDKLTAKGLTVQTVQTVVRAEGGVFSLEPFSCDFAESKVTGAVIADLTQRVPKIRVKGAADGMNIATVLEALTGKADISGKASISADLAGHGDGADSIMSSLGGSARVSATGSLNGVKLPQVNLTSAPGVKQVSTVDAQIRSFSASFNGSGGVFKNNDMFFDTSVAKGNGSGTVNLGSSSLDYLVKIDTGKINLPIRISGSFSNLSYTLDAQAMLTDPDNLKEGANQLLKHKGKSIEKEINKGLNKLLGN